MLPDLFYTVVEEPAVAMHSCIRYRCGMSGVRFLGRSNRHSVANGLPSLRRFFGAVLPRRYAAEMAPPLVTCFGVIPRV